MATSTAKPYPARVRASCKDCNTTVAMDWWVGRYKSGGGSFSARCHECYLAYTRKGGRVRPSCIDCETTVGMDWWCGSIKGTGTHVTRCHHCYLTYVRRRQTPSPVALHLVVGPLHGPPRPKGGIIFPCADCGSDYHKLGPAERCADCSVANEASRRGVANARRLAAQQRGDRGINWRKLGERDDWCCHLCDEPVPQIAGTATEPMGATVDHLVPIVAGGQHVWSNVALAHRVCNVARGAKPLTELQRVA